jgi:hypothetical protein
VTKLESSEEGFIYSFNQEDFFQSSIKLRYLPDLVIHDMEPKQALILTTVKVKIYALHASAESRYWCAIGKSLYEAVPEKEIVHGTSRIYLLCQIPGPALPSKVRVDIVYNLGYSRVSGTNFVDFRYPNAPVYDSSSVLSALQLQE